MFCYHFVCFVQVKLYYTGLCLVIILFVLSSSNYVLLSFCLFCPPQITLHRFMFGYHFVSLIQLKLRFVIILFILSGSNYITQVHVLLSFCLFCPAQNTLHRFMFGYHFVCFVQLKLHYTSLCFFIILFVLSSSNYITQVYGLLSFCLFCPV